MAFWFTNDALRFEKLAVKKTLQSCVGSVHPIPNKGCVLVADQAAGGELRDIELRSLSQVY